MVVQKKYKTGILLVLLFDEVGKNLFRHSQLDDYCPSTVQAGFGE